MEILCPACQKKLQIADSSAGQMVRCPSCSGTFQAPSLPSMGPLPPLDPPAAPLHSPSEPTFSLQIPPALAQASAPAAAGPVPRPTGDYTHSIRLRFRQEIATLLPPVGLVALLILSFFSWRLDLNLWELAFSQQGFSAFLYYVLLMILAAPLIFLKPLTDRNIVPAPPALRPFIPWLPLLIAVLVLVAWLAFFPHYLHCTFVEETDPARVAMKLAIRLHTVIAAAALIDLWLERRKAKGLPEPRITMRW